MSRLVPLLAALALPAAGCKLPGGIPLHAMRSEPPPGLAAKALAVGAAAPDFTLPDTGGAPFTLSQALAQGPVVAVFYRGRW